MDRCSPITLDDLLEFPAGWTAGEGAGDPNLSADGRRIIYGYQGHIWLLEVDHAEPERLTEGHSSRWTPAGDDGVRPRELAGSVPRRWRSRS